MRVFFKKMGIENIRFKPAYNPYTEVRIYSHLGGMPLILCPQPSLEIFYQPTTEEGALNGELTFGGVDESKLTGPLNFVSVAFP